MNKKFHPKYSNIPRRSVNSILGQKIPWELFPNIKIYSNISDLKLSCNSISTAKYSFFNFLPKNLFEQFCKLPNLYFLIIGLLQIIKEISTSDGIPVILMPLAFILFITSIKDLAEDLKRHKFDYEENNRITLVLKENG